MRYAQRGGYTPAEQQRRELLRLEAAGRFARGDEIGEIAHDLRVTEGSVRRWHRAWRDGGTAALRSKGPVSRERLSPQQWARLELELRKGPLVSAHGARGRTSRNRLVNAATNETLIEQPVTIFRKTDNKAPLRRNNDQLRGPS
jgi:transposase